MSERRLDPSVEQEINESMTPIQTASAAREPERPRSICVNFLKKFEKIAPLSHLPLTTVALFAALSTLSPSLVMAQTGISEADVIQEEEEKEMAQDPGADLTERDALSTRPTVNITAPGVDDGKGEGEPVSAFGGDKIKVRLNTASRVVSLNNLDFRRLGDDYNIQDQFDTDDRRTFGVNQMSGGLTFMPADEVTLDLGLRHNSLWGGGRYATLNNDNMLIVDNLFFTWTPINSDVFSFTTRVGRQYFEIGGAGEFGGAKRDYFFWDVVDGLTIDVGFGMGGKLRILAVDFAGTQFRPDEVDFYTRQRSTSSDINMRGDTVTYRSGLVYENTELVEGLELRAFGFYADIGAGADPAFGTAADICYGGQLCNFTDNDYNWMAGARAGYFFRDPEETVKVGGYVEYARSGGIDRKFTGIGLTDVNNDGNAFGAGVLGDFDLGSLSLGAAFQFFRADGPGYQGTDGIMFTHGFVSFKGAHIGGGLMDDNAGWHPSAYVSGNGGVDQTPQDQQRKSGTQSIYAGIDIGLMKKAELALGAWFLRDTGVSFLDPSKYEAEGTTLPFGYSLADLLAQRRLGKSLGTELDAGLSIKAHELINFFGQGAVFLPGEFYGIEIPRTGGTALGSTDPVNAWMVSGGVSIELR